MASAGIRKCVSPRTGRVSYKVWWRLDDGSQGSRTFAKKADATGYKSTVLSKGTADSFRHRRLRFQDWASEWWATWSTHPRRSPTALQATDSRLRRYVRPHFDHRLVQAITVRDIQQWQNALEARLASETVMACRSILYRILQAAEDDGIIAANPVRKVPAPKRPVDPEVVFGRVQHADPGGGRPAPRLLRAFLVGPRRRPARHRPAHQRARRPPGLPGGPGRWSTGGGRNPLRGRQVRQGHQGPPED
jgi:hypothetical protein